MPFYKKNTKNSKNWGITLVSVQILSKVLFKKNMAALIRSLITKMSKFLRFFDTRNGIYTKKLVYNQNSGIWLMYMKITIWYWNGK